MSNERKVAKIEGKITFADGETVDVLLALDGDSAWGNVERVLGRSVPVRQAIVSALIDEELFADEEDEDFIAGEMDG